MEIVSLVLGIVSSLLSITVSVTVLVSLRCRKDRLPDSRD